MPRHPTLLGCEFDHAIGVRSLLRHPFGYDSVGSSTSSIEPCTKPAHS